MNTASTNKTFSRAHFYKVILALAAGLLLIACDSVPTETSPNLGGSNRVLGYDGPPCSTADTCTFKVEFWNKMSDSQCANCHDSQSKAPQLPFFLESSDVNQAYAQTLPSVNPYVDLANPANSSIVSQIQSGHNCGNTGACDALASNVITYIENWAQGGADTSGGETNNTIVLTPPTIRDTGTSRSFPATGATVGTNSSSFANTIWPLLNTNCAGCHQESSPTPQSPFIAEDDVETAYSAVIDSQKINLDDPAISRLVVRLDPEFHNCWVTPTGADPTGCTQSGTLMLNAIIAFRDGISLTQVNPLWLTSKALDLTDGILASGGARDDSSTIALYEMKAGSGNTIYDTSGVEPALNLDLDGTEGADFNWVGGWGIEFASGVPGQARGSAQNTKLRDHIVSSGEYSIEAWLVPANVNQGTINNPKRIITYSGGTAIADRNFTLGQAEYSYEYMNRNPNDPLFLESLITDDDDEDLQASQQHVVATYDPINGRKIYINGIDVSLDDNAGAGSTDPVTPGSLTAWDDSYALILGSEAGGTESWAGKLRLVAIHNRAMTPAQVLTNFEAGVGEKFYLMFSVSDLMNDPAAGDSNCFLASAVTTGNPRGDQCFIYMEVSQFDSYSYLFYQPIFISKNAGFAPPGSIIKGMRIGLNGKEPAVGQAFSNIGKNTPLTITANPAPTGYCVGIDSVTNKPLCGNTADGEQVLSDIGTIIALEKGAGADEFFLTFEQFGSFDDGNAHAEYVCDFLTDATCLSTTPVTGTPVSDIGLRTFDEINATMAGITGVDRNDTDVKNTFDTIRQQLPPVESIDGFVSANQMAIAQLAIQYCSVLVEDSTLRDNFFGAGFGFTSDVDTAFAGGGKDQIVDALYDNIVAYRALGNTTNTLANMPTLNQVKADLLVDPVVVDPVDPVDGSPYYPGNLYDRLYSTANCGTVTCDQVRTRAVVKALCTSVLGSATMLIQ